MIQTSLHKLPWLRPERHYRYRGPIFVAPTSTKTSDADRFYSSRSNDPAVPGVERSLLGKDAHKWAHGPR